MFHISLLPEPHAPGALTTVALTSQPSGVGGALELARQLSETSTEREREPTRDRWEAIATIAAFDLGAARAIEPHVDAHSILHEAGVDEILGARTSTWGVFAAEGGESPLTATWRSDQWTLTGTKPWCSLADRLDRALVTAHREDGERGLFAVDLRSSGVEVLPEQWHARGLTEIPSGPVIFANVPAIPVGGPGWYLRRPGFAWGGIGVAACWYGGAVGIARTLFERAGAAPDPLIAAHLGTVDEQVQSARRALAEAASLIDSAPDSLNPSILAKRVRATVARACEAVMLHVGHALGPAPLALDAAHAKRVADLQLYIRQHHAEKDDAALGAALAKSDVPPW
jgi:alkylation response protein AidB-like acyl-CoA dehydrogenase